MARGLIRKLKELQEEKEVVQVYVPIIKTKADAEYREKWLARMRTPIEQVNTERFAVECKNCGAPLKAIYERCEYCGSAYTEIKSLYSQKSASEKDGGK